MTDSAILEIRQLRQELAALVSGMSPWISTDEMCKRYDCTTRTLNNMERDGRIPFRKNGKWSRVEVMKRESELP